MNSELFVQCEACARVAPRGAAEAPITREALRVGDCFDFFHDRAKWLAYVDSEGAVTRVYCPEHRPST